MKIAFHSHLQLSRFPSIKAGKASDIQPCIDPKSGNKVELCFLEINRGQAKKLLETWKQQLVKVPEAFQEGLKIPIKAALSGIQAEIKGKIANKDSIFQYILALSADRTEVLGFAVCPKLRLSGYFTIDKIFKSPGYYIGDRSIPSLMGKGIGLTMVNHLVQGESSFAVNEPSEAFQSNLKHTAKQTGEVPSPKQTIMVPVYTLTHRLNEKGQLVEVGV